MGVNDIPSRLDILAIELLAHLLLSYLLYCLLVGANQRKESLLVGDILDGSSGMFFRHLRSTGPLDQGWITELWGSHLYRMPTKNIKRFRTSFNQG